MKKTKMQKNNLAKSQASTSRAIWNPPQRGPKPIKEESETGLGRKEFIFCSGCGIVYYNKAWHRSFEDVKYLKGNERIKFVLCPACQMIKDKRFEGELVISDIVSHKLKEDIKKVLKNSAALAFRRDPLDRIIEIKEEKQGLIVRTTENQLAVKLAKKIKSVFGGKMAIKYSAEDVARIKLIF